MINSYCLSKFTREFLIVISFLLISTSKSESNIALSGKFINETFLEQTVDKIPGTIPVYCFQMNFFSSDSVDISFGFEKANFTYVKDGEVYRIIKAYQGKDMIFYMNADNSLTLVDSVWTGIPSNSRFISTGEAGDEKTFVIYLNNNMIAGEYFSFLQDKFTDKRITFQPDGVITGMESYNQYYICYSGDCTGETKNPANIVYLRNTKGEETGYAFTKSKVDGSVILYELGPPIKDIKGERTIGGKFLDIRR